MVQPDDPTQPLKRDEPETMAGRPVPARSALALTHIGRYRLEEVLGRGGMGIVYRARQESPSREVAIKVIAGRADEARLRRLEFEAEMLGKLHHPGIAQIYEAGVHEEDGERMPFFAMELVEGRELQDFDPEHKLDTRARLELFARICHAVEHAHQQGVIHRDLKPANILVTADGQPKILDFGIARATHDTRSTIERTVSGNVMGTLPYMSPEQLSGDPSLIDTRTDVYALGVILYHLLVGQHPHPIADTEIPVIIDIVREREPRSLSSLSPELASTLVGDLETIALKALEKDRERRYSSASELAEDVRRYLADEPITAVPPSTLYQLRKFARRHRALVVGTGVAALALIAGTTVATIMAVRATHAGERLLVARNEAVQERDRADAARDEATAERDRADAARAEVEKLLVLERSAREEAQAATRVAESERESARTVLQFLVEDVLAAARPTREGNDITVTEAVRLAAGRVGDGRFADRPLIEIAVRDSIANTLVELGQASAAVSTLERARELLAEQGLEDERLGITVLGTYGMALVVLGEGERAEEVLLHVLEDERRTLGEEDARTQTTRMNLLALYDDLARYDDALRIGEPLVDAQLRVLGAEHPETLRSRARVMGVRVARGELEGLEAPLLQLLELQRRVLGPSSDSTVTTLGDLAQLYLQQARFQDALDSYLQLLPLERKVYGAEHPRVRVSESVVGDLLMRLERFDEGLAVILEAYEHLIAERGADDLYAINVGNRYLGALMQANRMEEALPSARELFERTRQLLGLQHPETQSALAVLATTESFVGDLEQGVDLGRELLAVRSELYGPTNGFTLHAKLMLGESLMASGRTDEGLSQLTEALDILETSSDRYQLALAVQMLEGLLPELEEHPAHDELTARAAELHEQVSDLLR